MTNQIKCPGDWPDDDISPRIKIDEDGKVSIDWHS